MQVAASDLTRRRVPKPQGRTAGSAVREHDGRASSQDPISLSLRRKASRCWRGGSLRGAICMPGRNFAEGANSPSPRRPSEPPQGGSGGRAHDVARPTPGGSSSGPRASPFRTERRSDAREAARGTPATVDLRGDDTRRSARETRERGDAGSAALRGLGGRSCTAWRHADVGSGDGGARGSRARRLAAHAVSGTRPRAASAPGPITLGARAPAGEDQRLRDAGVVVRAGDVASRPPA